MQKQVVDGGPPRRQAGDRRDPDAGVDDLVAPADPRRGVRRRQRGARRRRRRDAVGRDERRGLPDRRRTDDGADHRDDRGQRPGADRGVEGLPHTRGGITRAAAEVGEMLGARYLVAFTQRGDTARRLSRYRSPIPLLAFTPEQAVRSQLSLVWGVETFLAPSVKHTDEMVRRSTRPCSRSAACRGRPGGHRRRLAARHPRLDQCHARAPDR